MHMISDCSRDTDATRRAFGLEPRHHIHRVAVQVSAVGNRIANVDPNAEQWNPSSLASNVSGNDARHRRGGYTEYSRHLCCSLAT